MIFGLLSGIFWALDTLLLSFISTFALIICFLHDFIAACVLIFTTNIKAKKDQIKILVFAGVGGGLGMLFYLFSIHLSSAGVAGILSSLYPVITAILANFILAQRLSFIGYFGLFLAILGTFLLFNINLADFNILGAICALLCAFCWGSECVIVNIALNKGADEKTALFIRQCVSSFISLIGIIFILLFGKIDFNSQNILFIIFASLLGLISYLFYYKAIGKIGALKAMGLNISYSAWIVLFGILFGNKIDLYLLFCAFLIITGSVLSNKKALK